jgi:oligopeptidase A
MENPLLAQSSLPAFAFIRPEHVEPAVREVLAASRARIDELAALGAPSFREVVEPLEELHHRVSRVWSPVNHLNAVLNSEALRASYNACLPLLCAYQTDLAQSEPLYRAYEGISKREGPELGPVERRVVEHALRDFRLAGVGLDAQRKRRFKTVMLELTQLQAKFEENVLDATNGWTHHVTNAGHLRGLNETIVEQARKRALEKHLEGWLLTLDQPTYVAVVTDAEHEPLRRAVYEAWTTRASDRGANPDRWDNSQVMENILELRHEAARLLEFSNYADYALATRMARTVDEVITFLRELAKSARDAARKEFEELEAFAGRKLNAWDVGFYAERMQRERYSISQEELRPYFPLPHVLNGLFQTAERLFDLRIKEHKEAPVWHPDVRFFDIQTSAGPRSAVSISTPTRARTSAVARGWTSAWAARSSPRELRCRWPISSATCCHRMPASRRCSRTTTSSRYSMSSATACITCSRRWTTRLSPASTAWPGTR